MDVLETEYNGDGSDESDPILVGLRRYLENLAEQNS